jgi:chaperonin cofactor prefoldin
MQSFARSYLTRSALLGVLVGTTFVGFCGVGGAIAAEPKNANALETINSSHWTFKSLKMLAERYGCVISGSGIYFPPNDTSSRYEMAAAVNECLDQISDRFYTKEDQVAAQALFKEFQKEVAILRERGDSLEKHTATLESQQFSPTTKVFVEPVIYSQFPGLQPTHWAFQAVWSLAQGYRCTSDTPNTLNSKGTATSRYEMAVLLNTCLNLIGHRFANQKDLETAQALQKEFKPELTALKDRVDFLENRAATLEPQQFSTTTKLQGQAVVTFQSGGFR